MEVTGKMDGLKNSQRDVISWLIIEKYKVDWFDWYTYSSFGTFTSFRWHWHKKCNHFVFHNILEKSLNQFYLILFTFLYNIVLPYPSSPASTKILPSELTRIHQYITLFHIVYITRSLGCYAPLLLAPVEGWWPLAT